jgi:hypothetical protein
LRTGLAIRTSATLLLIQHRPELQALRAISTRKIVQHEFFEPFRRRHSGHRRARKGTAAMKKRYSILAREIGSGREIELCQVDSNPERVAEAAGMKVLRIHSSGRRYRIKRYDRIRIVDNGEASTIPHIRAEKPPDNADTTPDLVEAPATTSRSMDDERPF